MLVMPAQATPSAARPTFTHVSLRGVTKLYGRQRALAGVDLTLRPGRVAALLGPNGAGKSTLVGILSTLVRPTSGSVTFEAERVLEPREIRRAIGVLAHESFLYGELNAFENLRFYGELYDVADAPARLQQVLDEVGLSAEARLRPARTYSRGMLQRLALARVLLHGPELLLLDEPFTGLDRSGARALSSSLAAARAQGRIVLVVTHDFEAISGTCEHVLILRRGKIVLDRVQDVPFSDRELKEIYLQATE
ncbi:MAG: ABC transporter ATP-binding protein [Deltaproteobacteria bacterium]|nr:ABC transporter ATP-binding protein [Deltaproteobacteria bacterium]